jgi:zinc protease
MRLLRPTSLLIAFALGVSAAAQNGPRSGQWAHTGGKLAPDPAVTWGRLDNGVRYALLPHQGVPGRVSLRLLVLAGSLDEQPDELGIAHFTEHMAFRGTKNFRADGMVALFQKLGVEYGSDVNAMTSFDHTFYSLEYRENSPELLREGLRLFRDMGDAIEFDPTAIQFERRVILAEMRSRDSLAEREQKAALPTVLRGLQVGQRSPIGTEATIGAMSRPQFLSFYERCYRPELMVVIATGDFDPAAMQAMVAEQFAGMARRPGPTPARQEGKLDAAALRTGVYRITGIGGAETMAAVALPPLDKPETREARAEVQQREFVMQLLAQRLDDQVPGAGRPQALYEPITRHALALASLQVPGNQWEHGILAVDQIVRTTHAKGFDAGAVDALRRRQQRFTAHMIDQLPTLDPTVHSSLLTDSIVNHTVFTGFEADMRLQAEWLEKFTAADAQRVFRGLWILDRMAFHVGGDISADLKPADVLKKVQQYRKDGTVYLLPKAQEKAVFAPKPWGPPGEVVERREVPGLGAALLRYGNRVRANVLPSRAEPGLVRVLVRVGDGLLDMPGTQPALKEFGLNTVLASGSASYPAQTIGNVIDEKFLSFSFDAAEQDAFAFRGQVATENLETFLGVVTDFLHKPQFDPYAHKNARLQAAMQRTAQASGLGEAFRDLTDHLFLGDARFMWGSPLDYISLGIGDVKRWMEPSLARGYVEATLVGDFTEEQAVAILNRTLGALAPRADTKRADPVKPVAVKAPAGFKRIEFAGELNIGLATATWPVAGQLTLADEAALIVLAKVLEIRLREEIRENQGLSYSPSADYQDHNGFNGLALLQATADTSPKETDRAAKLMGEIAARLAQEGVREGEFIGARGILQSQVNRAFYENAFLLDLLRRAQQKPASISDIEALRGAALARLTRDDVNAWAAKILKADNARTAALVPKPFVGIFQSDKP